MGMESEKAEPNFLSPGKVVLHLMLGATPFFLAGTPNKIARSGVNG